MRSLRLLLKRHQANASRRAIATAPPATIPPIAPALRDDCEDAVTGEELTLAGEEWLGLGIVADADVVAEVVAELDAVVDIDVDMDVVLPPKGS